MIARSIRQRVQVVRGRRRFPAANGEAITWVGTAYGGWPIPESALDADSVCYLAGVGEDVSFDLELIERFGCEVHAFDPVPEAVAFGGRIDQQNSLFHFHPFGLWSSDTILFFHENPIDGYVSRSATDMHGTEAGRELNVRALPGLLAELGHRRINLLKLSVEGSEFELIEAILRDRIPVDVLCVEFAQPVPLARVVEAASRLERAGWTRIGVSIEPFNWKFAFRASG